MLFGTAIHTSFCYLSLYGSHPQYEDWRTVGLLPILILVWLIELEKDHGTVFDRKEMEL